MCGTMVPSQLPNITPLVHVYPAEQLLLRGGHERGAPTRPHDFSQHCFVWFAAAVWTANVYASQSSFAQQSALQCSAELSGNGEPARYVPKSVSKPSIIDAAEQFRGGDGGTTGSKSPCRIRWRIARKACQRKDKVNTHTARTAFSVFPCIVVPSLSWQKDHIVFQ
jgi:hypothetical protein